MRRRRNLPFLAALMLTLLAGVGLYAPSRINERHLAFPFDFFPMELGGWTGTNGIPPDAMPVDPQSEDQLLRTYRRGPQLVWVSVGHYRRQTESHRHPALDLLYPGQGWSTIEHRQVTIPIDGARPQMISPNAIVMRQPHRTVVTLYWHQVQSDTLISEYGNRGKLFINRLFRQRSDGSFVRIVSSVEDVGDVSSTLEAQTGFVQVFHPELLKLIPQ